LRFVESDHLKLNFDTGNTFISGQDPVKFLQRFINDVEHLHIKDVSKSLAEKVRGGQTGIAVSHVALGDGVNAENIRQCIKLLKENKFESVLSIEGEGEGGPMLQKSLHWLRNTLDSLNIEHR